MTISAIRANLDSTNSTSDEYFSTGTEEGELSQWERLRAGGLSSDEIAEVINEQTRIELSESGLTE